MESLLQDVRYAVRLLWKSPGFAAVAVLTLALGTGANTAVFSLINAVLLKPLPVADPQQLTIVGDPGRVHGWSNGSPRTDILSYPMYRELLRRNQVFTDMVAEAQLPRVIVESAGRQPDPQPVAGLIATGNYFSLLGVNAVAGRTFTAEDDRRVGGAPVVVLGYGYWSRRFAADPRVIGSTLRLNGFPFTVIGVTAPEFRGIVVGDNPALYVPVTMQPQIMPSRPALESKSAMWLNVFGRLRPGTTLEQARDRVNSDLQQIAHSEYASDFTPDDQDNLRNLKLEVHPGARGYSFLRSDTANALLVVMGIVGLVLLVACVNVATLLLARSSARKKEIAVRIAIGASPARILRQLLTESLLLAALGGIAGLLLAIWGVPLLGRFLVGGAAARLDTAVDARVLAVTAGVCLLTGILFGLAPAFGSLRVELAATLKDGGRDSSGSSRWSASRVLVAAQMAIAVLVVFAAGLLVHTLQNLRNADLGYDRERLLVMHIDPVSAGYKEARYYELLTTLQDRLRQVPGVRGVAFSDNGLFSGRESADTIEVEGFTVTKKGDRVAWNDQVGPGYFTTVGIPLLRGRDIGPQDTPSAPLAAVVNEEFARFYFGDRNPVGHRFYYEDSGKLGPPIEIVGVARDARGHGIRQPIYRRFYAALLQKVAPVGDLNFEIRTTGPEAAAADSVRAAVRAVDASLPITSLRTMTDLVEDDISDNVRLANLAGAFGALALALGAVGLYGVMSYAVSGRTREIGVRMALGAQRGDVLRMVLGESLLLVGAGIAVGIPVALVSRPAIAGMLYGIGKVDVLSLGSAVVLLGWVAAVAGWIPARRATRVDPMVALRYE